jgi:metallo-beta-lactamase family protein
LKIQFLGATRQVTGSCYYLEAGGLRILVECGLYQERNYLGRNWNPFPVSPKGIDYLLLTHVHLDHAGLSPKLVREDFSGTILTTSASNGMIPTVLFDSARIHEEDAAYKKKRHKKEGRKGPYPEIPLYTVEDVEKALPFFKNVPYEKDYPLNNAVSVRYCDAGHILGSAMVEIKVKENGSLRRVVFSGDIGQWDKPLVRDPSVFERADYVVMESTYGDRCHDDPMDVEDLLTKIIKETIKAGGNIVIPTFAIERAQELMYHLSRLESENRIPYLMMFLDSPMAVDITNVFRRYKQYLDEETQTLFKEGRSPFHFPGLRLVRSIEQSKMINSLRNPCIIMAGAGMCTGGRIKHHLKYNIIRPESTILFVGFQAEGTLGRKIVEKKESVRIHGRLYPVKARVEQIHGFSAHADQKALLKWLGNLKIPPERVFLTHGEEASAFALAKKIKSDLGWDAVVPDYLSEFEL